MSFRRCGIVCCGIVCSGATLVAALLASPQTIPQTMPQRRKLTHPLLLAVPWAAFYVTIFGLLYGAYQIVYLRVELGTRQQQSIDALEANPASFVWYTVRDAAF